METQDRCYSVFVSAPFSLKRERSVAMESILLTNNIPITLEFVPVKSSNTKEIISRAISESDIYIALLGHRYGTVLKEEDGSKISFSEWEYEFAKHNGIYTIVFLQDRSELHKKRNDLRRGQTGDRHEIENESRLHAFYEKLSHSGNIIGYWSEDRLSDLSAKITSSILKASAYLKETQPEKGWIRAKSEKAEDIIDEEDMVGEVGIVYGIKNIPDGNSVLELKLISDHSAYELSRKLITLNTLYDELCALTGVSPLDYPLKVYQVEVGSLWIKIFGESKVISLCAKLISSAMSYVYSNYTDEGKFRTIPEKIEMVGSLLELSKKLKKEGEDTLS
jgi:hypothetical protein